MTSLPFCMLLLAAGLTYIHAQRYVVEVLVYVDPQVVRKYQGWGYTQAYTARNQIRKEFVNTMEEVNNLYKSLNRFGLDIEIRFKDPQFLRTEVFSTQDIDKKLYIHTATASDRFQEYLSKYGITGYDAAILLTGYDLFGNDGTPVPAGIASVGEACNKVGTGVVEVAGTGVTAITFAHEIGHILGAEHDGDGNSCVEGDGYIMSATVSPDNANRWKFSRCTKNYFTKYIASLTPVDKNCLLDTVMSSRVYPKKEKDPLNPETICYRVLGEHSYFNKNPTNYKLTGPVKGDAVCKHLWCHYPYKSEKGTTLNQAFPSEGMVCDAGKRCYQGRCVNAPFNFPVKENVDRDCVFGDTRAPNLFTNVGGGCEYLVEQLPLRCEDEAVRDRCCTICKKKETGIPGCKYGNRASNCNDFKSLRNVCFGENLRKCCETCRDYHG